MSAAYDDRIALFNWFEGQDTLFEGLEAKLLNIGPERMFPEAQLEKLEEELEELREAFRHPAPNISRKRVREEAADVVIVAVMVARTADIPFSELMNEVSAKMITNVNRVWAAHNGTARHVEEGS